MWHPTKKHPLVWQNKTQLFHHQENLDILLYCGFLLREGKRGCFLWAETSETPRLFLLSAHLGCPVQEGAECVKQYSAKASYLAKQKSFFFFFFSNVQSRKSLIIGAGAPLSPSAQTCSERCSRNSCIRCPDSVYVKKENSKCLYTAKKTILLYSTITRVILWCFHIGD